MVRVALAGSRSTPLFAVPPLSWTWNRKLVSGEPLTFGVGLEGEGVGGHAGRTGGRDEIADADRRAGEEQRAAGGQAGDADGGQRAGIAVDVVGHGEVAGMQRLGLIFIARDRVVEAVRRIVDPH